MRTKRLVEDVLHFDHAPTGLRGLAIKFENGERWAACVTRPETWTLVNEATGIRYDDTDAEHLARSILRERYAGRELEFDEDLQTPVFDDIMEVPTKALVELLSAPVPAQDAVEVKSSNRIEEELLQAYLQDEDLFGKLTDKFNAETCAHLSQNVLRFVDGETWYRFTNGVWQAGRETIAQTEVLQRLPKFWLKAGEIMEDVLDPLHTQQEGIRDAKAFEKGIARKPKAYPSTNARGYARKCESSHKIKQAAQLMKSMELLQSKSAEFDRNPWLLNCKNGTLDLQAGRLYPHRATDYLTRRINIEYSAEAGCPAWTKAVDRMACGNDDLVDYLWRALGYSLTGDKTEHVIFFLQGAGANGKSTLFETMQKVLGKYSAIVSEGALLHSEFSAHKQEIAKLRGIRFAYQPEMKAKRLDEARLKQLSGGDMVSANFMRQDEFEFRPDCKLWMAGNSLPEITGADRGIWRRFKLIPFRADFTTGEIDLRINDKLAAELPGILAWLVRGCCSYLERGLKPPTCITEPTEQLRQEESPLWDFIRQNIIDDKDKAMSRAQFLGALNAWLEKQSEDPLKPRDVSKKLREMGWETKMIDGVRYWKGKSLKAS